MTVGAGGVEGLAPLAGAATGKAVTYLSVRQKETSALGAMVDFKLRKRGADFGLE